MFPKPFTSVKTPPYLNGGQTTRAALGHKSHRHTMGSTCADVKTQMVDFFMTKLPSSGKYFARGHVLYQLFLKEKLREHLL